MSITNDSGLVSSGQRKLEDANLSNDFLFYKTMIDPATCKAVIEEILEISIDSIETINYQKALEVGLDSHGVRFDVVATDSQGQIYNIEMQNSVEGDLGLRSRYYQGMLDIDSLERGSFYSSLPQTFIIFFCSFDPFGRGLAKYTFSNLCEESIDGSVVFDSPENGDLGLLRLDDRTKKIFLNTKASIVNVSDELAALLKYIDNSTDLVASRGHLVQFVHQRVLEVKSNKKWKVEFMTLDEIKEREYKLGLAEGREEGLAEGREEGREDTMKNVILNLQSSGMSEEKISELLKIGIEEVLKFTEDNLH